ncbi:methyltransferase-like protein 27 isoform X1 [Lates japonicus]
MRMWQFWTTIQRVMHQTASQPISVVTAKQPGCGLWDRTGGKAESFDVVVICGALSVDHVPVSERELCNACKPGGCVCMTCRHGHDNVEYKAALEHELRRMEEEGLWSCVAVTEVENWARAVSEAGDGYVPGSVYLYRKL